MFKSERSKQRRAWKCWFLICFSTTDAFCVLRRGHVG